MKVRLKESYNNEILTTLSGYIIRKGEWTEVNEEDFEIKRLLEQPNIFEKFSGELKGEIIKDSPPKDTIKEVVSQENKEKINEALKSGNDDSGKLSSKED